MVKKSNGLKVE